MTVNAETSFFGHTSVLARVSCAQLISTAKMGDGVVSGWTICDTNTDFCMIFRVFSFYKTDN